MAATTGRKQRRRLSGDTGRRERARAKTAGTAERFITPGNIPANRIGGAWVRVSDRVARAVEARRRRGAAKAAADNTPFVVRAMARGVGATNFRRLVARLRDITALPDLADLIRFKGIDPQVAHILWRFAHRYRQAVCGRVVLGRLKAHLRRKYAYIF